MTTTGKRKTKTWLVVGLLATIGLPFALSASGCGPSGIPRRAPPPTPPTTRGGPSSMRRPPPTTPAFVDAPRSRDPRRRPAEDPAKSIDCARAPAVREARTECRTRSLRSSLEEQTGLVRARSVRAGGGGARSAPRRAPARGGDGRPHARRGGARPERGGDASRRRACAAARARRSRRRSPRRRGSRSSSSRPTSTPRGAPPTTSASSSRGAAGRGDAEDTAQGDVLVFAASESSPYADVNPDRRAAMSRHGDALLTSRTSCRGASSSCPPRALARKVVPRRDRARARAPHRRRGRSSIATRSCARSSEAGYLRVPVVEDPGSLRGPRRAPRRVAALEPRRRCASSSTATSSSSIKPFDPHRAATTKRRTTAGRCETLWLPPAREAILDGAHRRPGARARDAARRDDRSAHDARRAPSSTTSSSGRAFFGAEGFLPAYYDDSSRSSRYLPERRRRRPRRPAGDHARRSATSSSARRATPPRRRAEPTLPAGRVLRDEDDVARELAARAVVALHRTAVVGQARPTARSRAFEVAPRARSTSPRATTTTSRAR